MRRETERAGHRHARLQGIIFEELRALLNDEVSDPLLDDVQVTAAILSVDYRHLRVHCAAPSDERHAQLVVLALQRAAPFIRARLADAIDLKRVPELRFVVEPAAPDGQGP